MSLSRPTLLANVTAVVLAAAFVPACTPEGPTAAGSDVSVAPVAPGAPSADPGAAPAPPAPGAAQPSGPSPAAPPSPSPSPGSSRPDPAISEPAAGPPGAFAGVLLRPAPASRIVVAVASQDGAAPGSALQRAAAVLREHSGKRVDVRGPEPVQGDASWTPEEIRALAPGDQGEGDAAVVRVAYLRGRMAGEAGSSALGVAVRGDTLAVFPDQIEASDSPLVPASTIEEAVLVHELGHLLGLVDLFLDRGRDDPEHPGHSTNRGSVMYWAVESSLVGQVLGGPPPREFDEADVADMRAIREGAGR